MNAWKAFFLLNKIAILLTFGTLVFILDPVCTQANKAHQVGTSFSYPPHLELNFLAEDAARIAVARL